MSDNPAVGKKILDLHTPCFVVSLPAVESNCARMLEWARAAGAGVAVRGQTKTHKCVRAAELQTGGTRRCLVTSTFAETQMFADAGFDDILYGYPLIEDHMDRNWALTERLDEYHVMVTNLEAAKILAARQPPKGKKWSAFLKIDCGNRRAGVWWEDDEAIAKIATALKQSEKTVDFRGLYVHCGNSYGAADADGVRVVRDDTIRSLLSVREKLSSLGISVRDVGIGSTPSCSQRSDDQFAKLTEMHPGNYVFYDNQQIMLGSCTERDVAGRVMTRVIGHYPTRRQILIDCGFLGLTKQGFEQQGGSFAVVQGHPELKVTAMTQEIGFVEVDTGRKDDAANAALYKDKFPVGSVLFLIPYHSCATAAMYPHYYVHGEDGVVREVWTPCRGW